MTTDRRFFKLYYPLLIFLSLLTISNVQGKSNFETLSNQILVSIQAFYPVKSTEMGIHSYDYHLADYSSSSVKKMTKSLNKFQTRLYKYKSAKLTREQKINYKLLKSNLDIALLDLRKIRWHKKSPQLYVDEAINGLYFLMLSGHAPMSEKVVAIISRMKQVPALFKTAKKNISKPPQVYIDAALESLESAIEFYKLASGKLMSQFPERADNILKISTRAREAMTDFSSFLIEITPGKETAFSIGKDNFDYKLKHEYFFDFDSDSLLKIGESLLADAQKAYRTYEKYLEDSHQNGADSVYVPKEFNRQDILDYYNWETNQVKIFLEKNNIINVPENIGQLSVIETPPFLRSMHGGIAYQPAGPFDSEQHGYFYVRPIPEDLNRRLLESRYRYVHRRGFKGSVVHEAYPGHHLQLQIAGMNKSKVRKWQFNIMMIEGWALYSEEMMYENGLFGDEDPVQWLGILGGIRYRAARIVVDVKLHTGQFSYDQCVAWMNETLDIETEGQKAYIRKEVRRYTHNPTYQMSYLMGKREILRLREAYKNKHYEDYTLAAFHNWLLEKGSLPPALIWDYLK